jgi:hypothetical protein
MDSYKASRVFKVPQTTLERYVKDQQKSSNLPILGDLPLLVAALRLL